MMTSAWIWSQSMARAEEWRLGPHRVCISCGRQFAISSGCTLPLRATPRRGCVVVSGHPGHIAFAGLDPGPNGPCHACGQGDCQPLHRVALQHLPPLIFARRPAAAVGDLGELLFAAAGMRFWYETDRHAGHVLSARRDKVTCFAKVRHVRPGRGVTELIGQKLDRLPGGLGQGGVFGQGQQVPAMVEPVRRNHAVFGQLGADGVRKLGSVGAGGNPVCHGSSAPPAVPWI